MKSAKCCWNCKEKIEISSLFCEYCNIIQKPFDYNKFSLFQLEEKVSIKVDMLEKSYLYLQKKVHPDKFLNSSKIEQEFSSIHSSKINEAYNDLKSTTKRVEILLKIKGFKSEDKEKSFDDKDMLEEVMEFQSKSMMIEDYEDKRRLLKEINGSIEQIVKKIEASLEQKLFEEAKKSNIKLSYLEKIKKGLG